MIQLNISTAFNGGVTARDLLNNEGSLEIIIDNLGFNNGGVLFHIIDDSPNAKFVFSLSIHNQTIILQRNDIVSILTVDDIPFCQGYIITVTWSFTELTINCSFGIKPSDSRRAVVKTIPTVPPNTLLRWARKNNLLPIEEYNSEEEFRNKVHSCLISIQDKLNESGSFQQFWNILYDGQKIIKRTPKNEIEVQPIIHALLSDQFLMSSIEIIPEYNSGVGNLDFLFISKIKDMSFAYFSAEFKNAHSHKLENGLLEQLPCYMENKNSKYGAYCVLDYRGQDFDKPDIQDSLESYLSMKNIFNRNPYSNNVRIIVYNLSKPISASRR